MSSFLKNFLLIASSPTLKIDKSLLPCFLIGIFFPFLMAQSPTLTAQMNAKLITAMGLLILSGLEHVWERLHASLANMTLMKAIWMNATADWVVFSKSFANLLKKLSHPKDLSTGHRPFSGINPFWEGGL